MFFPLTLRPVFIKNGGVDIGKYDVRVRGSGYQRKCGVVDSLRKYDTVTTLKKLGLFKLKRLSVITFRQKKWVGFTSI